MACKQTKAQKATAEKLDSAKWEAHIKELRGETRDMPRKHVVDHYIAAILNLESALDQRDALQKKNNRLKSQLRACRAVLDVFSITGIEHK